MSSCYKDVILTSFPLRPNCSLSVADKWYGFEDICLLSQPSYSKISYPQKYLMPATTSTDLVDVQ